MEVTQQTEESVNVGLFSATYQGPIRFLQGSRAQVLIRTDRPTVLRAKIYNERAGNLAAEWITYPRDQFEVGEPQEVKAQN